MDNNVDSGSRNSRSVYRTKRKKTNTILNSLIIIVLLLIIFVAYLIFSSGNNNASSQNASAKQVNKQSQHSASAQNGNSSKGTSGTANNTADSNSSNTSAGDGSNSNANTADTNNQGAGKTQSADQAKAVVTQGGSSPDVSKTVQNPDWKPVGTSQTGKHTTTYDSSSVDWQEMLSAISYAAGIDQSNMTVWFLGRDDSNSNGAIGTVEDKSSKQKYRVYIQWVDGQGWEPTKVEQLTH